MSEAWRGPCSNNLGEFVSALFTPSGLARLAASTAISFCTFGLLPAQAFADDGLPVPGSLDTNATPLHAKRGPAEDPFLRVLSGPGWLGATGMDPRLIGLREGGREGSEFNTMTRRTLESSSLSAQRAPASQVGGVSVPYRDPGPAFSRNILITRDYSKSPFQVEPHLAIDPKDPDHIVVGVIDYNFPGVTVYVTFDGGETWEGPIPTRYVRDDLLGAGDPVLAFDRAGNVYLTYMSLGIEEFQVGRFATAAQVTSIAVTVSKDGGLTWSDPVSTARRLPETRLGPSGADQRVRGSIRVPFLDKPWMSIGPDPSSPAKDLIHISFTEFIDVEEILYIDELPYFASTGLETTIRTVHSSDLGKTWSDIVSVSPSVVRHSGKGTHPGATITEGQLRIVQGSEPHVAPDGTVYVSWMDTTDDDSQKGLGEIYVARSDNGGKKFGKPVRATVLNEPGFRPRTNFFRYWGTVFPKVAIGPQGEVYLAYGALNPAKPIDDGDVFFIRSMDKGVTWSAPKRLSGDDSNSLQFYPAISVDPEGTLHAMYGDMRDDPKQTAYHIYYTTSKDKGTTWGFDDARANLHTDDTRVSDFPSNPNKGFPGGRFIGDYFSIAASSKDVAMVWSDTRLGEYGGGYNQKVAFARKRAIPNPQVFISPPSGAGGQSITVQGFNLQPGISAYIQVGGQVVQTQRTNADGRFTAQIFVPVTGEGAQDVRVIDESGNVAGTSYYTEFGFGSIRDGQNKLQAQIKAIVPAAAGGPQPAKGSSIAAWWMVGVAAVAGLGAGSLAVAALRPRHAKNPSV